MKLGIENRKQIIWAAALGVLAVAVICWQVLPMFSGPSTATTTATPTTILPALHPAIRSRSKSGKGHTEENLDPTLQLQLLAASEDTKYSGSGRNIFVSQADDPVAIPKPNAQAATDHPVIYTTPTQPQAPPITLKFFGFANQPGEPKKIFLSQGEDVFIAGEGEIIDRRYKVVRISPTSVEIQDLVNSGPPQTVQLTQG